MIDFSAQPHTTKAGFFRRDNFFNNNNNTSNGQSTVIREEAVSSYLIGYQNPVFKFPDGDIESPLQTEIEVTDYMLREPPIRMMRLGDPLIDERMMSVLEEK